MVIKPTLPLISVRTVFIADMGISFIEREGEKRRLRVGAFPAADG
jgi:hypothetical protein